MGGEGLSLRDGASRTERIGPADLAWLLAPALAAAAIPVVLVLAPWLGELALPSPAYHYWNPENVVRKPATQAGYLLVLGFVAAYVAVVALAGGRRGRMDATWRRRLVLLAQLLAAALVAASWAAQPALDVPGRPDTSRTYFTAATLLVAVTLVVAVSLAVAHRDRLRLRARAAGLPRLDPRAARAACLAAAALVVVLWLLPAIYTDRAMGALDATGQLAFPPELFHNTYYFGEALAVLNGRSPLVDMPAYGSLWPYVVAPPLAALGESYAAFTALMTAITAVALLAVYGVLRRVAGGAGGLVLFVPFVATSCFVELGSPTWRYDSSSYFGAFPLRYAGPYLLLWLTARAIARERVGPATLVPLFAAAGLVAVNNLDFGLSAVAATLVALLMARPPSSARRLALSAAAGVAVAAAAVCALTLARTGSLPQLELLTRYGRIFVNGGYGNIALEGAGWHVAVTLTFVAAVATAAVRVADGGRDRMLTGLLAWVGTFGLGASAYFYVYRSHPDVLINLFSIWSLAIALLVVALGRTLRARGRVPAVPALLVLLGFALTVCSVAQLPLPWRQLDRLAADGALRPLVLTGMTAAVAERTRPGEPVLVLVPVGHRVAEEAGVENVNPYPGLGQMPAREQLDDAIGALRRAGGDTVFVGQETRPGVLSHLARNGYARVERLPAGGWGDGPILVLRRGSG